jgi:hypothetical protein
MFLIGPHGALLHNETCNKIHHGPIHLPKQPKQPIILVQREFYRKVGEGQCTLECDQRLLVPNKIGNPTYHLLSYPSGLAGSLD